MSQSNYNPEQRKAYKSVRNVVCQLHYSESLQKRIYQPALGTSDAIDQAANLALKRLPSYHTLEGRLREAITKARKVGLTDDLVIVRIEDSAFS